jgi:putative ABC transport system substrate-binding protein
MRRREFLGVLGVAAGWPLSGQAQQRERIHRVGVLIANPKNHPFARAFVAAITAALGRLGWVEGKNIRFYFRFAAGDPALFKADAVLAHSLARIR